jgi:hypothetical protein
VQQPLQPGAGDNEQPMEPSRHVAAIESLQALAQCSREEARYYLEVRLCPTPAPLEFVVDPGVVCDRTGAQL